MEDRVKLALEALKDAREVLDLGGARHVVGTDKAIALITRVDQAIAALSAPEEPSGWVDDDVCGHCGRARKDHAPEAYCPSPVFATLAQFTPVGLVPDPRSPKDPSGDKFVISRSQLAHLWNKAKEHDRDEYATDLGETVAFMKLESASRQVVPGDAIGYVLSEGQVPVDVYITADAFEILIDAIFSLQLPAPQPVAGIDEASLRAIWEAGVAHGYGHSLRVSAPRDKERDDAAFDS